ncbi:type I-E CRISPR-associated protein Cse1/CasA [Nonomuraea wenchangensis]|uniref:type I-E CRISPR-associated protein Cse1/CasA n=1 Tax=Nonomuraea wenchangensis TaxID=568860 RepID=UPI00379C6C14
MQRSLAATSFDLTQQRWLPVQHLDGTEDELSLHDVFARATEIRRLVGDVPTQEFALLRLLLAILHDVVEGPEDIAGWQELWHNGLPVELIASYLKRHRERFDLLHPTQPFFQTAELRTARDQVNGLDRIVADVPNGLLFFTMRGRGVDHLTFAEAARWLLHAHAFDTSGIKTGVVGDPRARGGRVYPQGVAWAGHLGGLFVEGQNLQQTLLLNLIAFDTDLLHIEQDLDSPAWRRPPSKPGQADAAELSRRPAGVRDIYTWQSRRVRLFHDGRMVTGVILTYGDPLDPYNQYQRETMSAWRRSPAQEMKLGLAQVYMPREHDARQRTWQGLEMWLTGHAVGAEQRGESAAIVRPRILDWIARIVAESGLPSDFRIRVRLIGIRYGTQQSVIDDIVDDAVTIPVLLLHPGKQQLRAVAIGAVADAEAAVNALVDLVTDLARAEGHRVDSLKAKAYRQAFARLDGVFRAWLAAIAARDDAQERRAEWQRQIYEVIDSLASEFLQAAGDRSWEGHVFETKNSKALWLNDSYASLIFKTRLHFALPDRGQAALSAFSDQVLLRRQIVADIVEDVTASCIGKLQQGYNTDRRTFVAVLARLRRGAGKLPEEVPEPRIMTCMEQLRSTLHVSEREALEAEFALYSAVTLYALHQQSQPSKPMHRTGADLGTAVRRLMPDDALDEAVRRRFIRLGTAATRKMLAERLREIVILLRDAGLPLDYGILARQVYQAQDPESLRHVRQSWGRSFHSYRSPSTHSGVGKTAS